MQLEFTFEAPKQLELKPGGLNLDGLVRKTLKTALQECKEGRAVIAEKASLYSGRNITENNFNAWCAPSRTAWQLPFHLVPAIESALETYCLTNMLAEVRGAKMLIGEDALMAELGKLERIAQEVKIAKATLKRRLA